MTEPRRPDDFSDADTPDTVRESPVPPFVGAVTGRADPTGPPDQVGRYRIEGELGRGGMGVVYRGHDPDLDRPLAVKVLLLKHHGDESLVQRFLDEARVMGRLQHPGVAPIHELGQLPDGRPFFAMKQIQGKTLAQLLDEGKRKKEKGKIERWLAIFEQVCQAVAYAHTQGILHRDLKPANVMVGAFGEVQVLDWGLAKVMGDSREKDVEGQQIARRSETMPAGDEGIHGGPTRIASADSSSDKRGRPASTPSSRTEAGSVLGTPAYMAPEQARGEIATLDERCDVFGLGAILCEILTGQPPFVGTSALDSLTLAMRGDLTDAFTRVDRCGADAELIQLARACLARDRDGRPRDGDAVAAAVERYRAGVQERLRQAEIGRAAAVIKAAEERKKRRWQLALAGLAVILVMAAAGAGVWYYWDRAALAEAETQRQTEEARREAELKARRAQLDRDLGESVGEAKSRRALLHAKLGQATTAARLLSDTDGWKSLIGEAREDWKRASASAAAGKDLVSATQLAKLKDLDQALHEDEKDWDRARELENVRLRSAAVIGGTLNPANAVGEYTTLFQKLGMPVDKGTAEELAAKIRKSPLRFALVAALDHWADVLVTKAGEAASAQDEQVERLLKLSRLADPDSWRNQVRDPDAWHSLPKLRTLAKEAHPNEQTPQILILLAWRLHRHGASADAVQLLRLGQVYYERDFWLHFSQGQIVAGNPDAEIGCYTAALTVRPDNEVAHNNLGAALYDKKDFASALGHFQKAVAINDRDYIAHYNLGNVLHEMKKLDAAIASFKKAAALNPAHANSWNNLGIALVDNKDLKDAIEAYQKAVDLAPDEPVFHYNLANALYAQFEFKDAIEHYEKALAKRPDDARTHRNLGNALLAVKDIKGAIEHYQQALALEPRDSKTHYNLANVFFDLGKLREARSHYEQTVEIEPTFTQAHYNLARVLQQLKDFPAAISEFEKVTKQHPNIAMAHCLLGLCYREQGELAKAVMSLQRGNELASKLPDWNVPSAMWLAQCVQLHKLEPQLPAILEGKLQPKDVAERAVFGALCHYRKYQVASARLYAAAFKAEPKLLSPFEGDPKSLLLSPHPYNAVCASILAAKGQAKDADRLEKGEAAKLRQQALDWLRLGMTTWKQQAAKDPGAASLFHILLRYIQDDPDLASVRDAQALAQLPPAERKGWQDFWAEVAKQAS